MREADELCVESMRRSDRLESINTYVATYKLHDPQWQPLLLPEVHVLQAASNTVNDSGEGKESRNGWREPQEHTVDDLFGTPFSSTSSLVSTEGDSAHPPPPPPPHGPRKTHEKTDGWSEVYIHYNKLTSLELMSRHANFALRHIVQRGHAMYFITVSQHSILAPRGLVEASHITCAYGVKGERLRTTMQHVGPLDARDVLHLDPNTRRVQWEWDRHGVPRGVVAVSLVEGYGTWFQRKPMLWQRSRRIGALQAEMGAHQFLLSSPESVGRWRDYEVSLLEPHTRLFGAVVDGPSRAPEPSIANDSVSYSGDTTPRKNTTSPSSSTMPPPPDTVPKEEEEEEVGGGPDRRGNGDAFVGGGGGGVAVGIVASSQVAQNPKLYIGAFEAPVVTALDAVHQLAYRSAVQHHLVRPMAPPSSSSSSPILAVSPPTLLKEESTRTSMAIHHPKEDDGVGLWRRRLRMEEFLPISWTTRTPPPYVPLEAELPFTVQLSRPSVLPLSSSHGPEGPSSAGGGSAGTIGMPMLQRKNVVFDGRGEATRTLPSPPHPSFSSSSSPTLPVACMEFVLHQGVDHYVFDDSPSARPMKWWQQKSNMPYNGTLYAMRSGWLDVATPSWNMTNPLHPKTRAAGMTARKRERRKRSGGVHSPCEMVAPGDCYLIGHQTEDVCGERTRKTPASHSTTLDEKEGERQDVGEGVVGWRDENCPAMAGESDTKAMGMPSPTTVERAADMEEPPPSSSLPVSLLVSPNSTAGTRMARYHRAALRFARKKKLRRKKAGKE